MIGHGGTGLLQAASAGRHRLLLWVALLAHTPGGRTRAAKPLPVPARGGRAAAAHSSLPHAWVPPLISLNDTDLINRTHTFNERAH